ncbi:D-Ala-D-Ala carboxypeptidase family metallohydrolase [Asticcacaulis sp. EMRT-3]|uniref:D-Ala-D-Ala carboxypeptidase family metallohydrolase n=1 Tax=Asticcacaulis sp. EMRT-3 TaxID=3040349 RepID=UPI0024AEB9D2|nr:D-Ala-D-Ala carboxypeptidase family metallohydrolase [Asticcacaulis sp. EMRT-3]MDI7774984.1 D-Ala-D-Ala carboxypeptidase family metallohydrolase [Asticcacaulis sp. EMRT-3]
MTGRLYKQVSDFDATGWQWPHFTPHELSCRCGKFCAGEYYHDPAFLDALEAMRTRLGQPLTINSGRRCPLHNAAVGGAPLSQHRVALAVDINVAGWGDRARGSLLKEALAEGFTGFGYGTHFLHLDRRHLTPPRTRPAQWDYANGGMKTWTSYLA